MERNSFNFGWMRCTDDAVTENNTFLVSAGTRPSGTLYVGRSFTPLTGLVAENVSLREISRKNGEEHLEASCNIVYGISSATQGELGGNFTFVGKIDFDSESRQLHVGRK